MKRVDDIACHSSGRSFTIPRTERIEKQASRLQWEKDPQDQVITP